METVVFIRLRSYMNVISPPLGIGYLLNALKGMEGINPFFIDCQLENISKPDLLERLKSLDPAIVGFQLYSVNYFDFHKLIPQVRAVCPHAVLIAGGPHVSGLPEYTLTDNPDLDYVVRGEGEEAIQALVRHHLDGVLNSSLDQVPNLVFRQDSQIVCNPVQFVDVDHYGMPAWERLHPERYPTNQHGTFHKGRRVVPLLTSRGCPYPCSYCMGHLITGKKVRVRDLYQVIDEIEFLHTKYGFDEFTIEDENFVFYKPRVLEFSREIRKRNIRCCFSFPNGIRADMVDEEVICALKDMGGYIVGFGIESASSKILQSIHKKWDLEEIQNKIQLAQKHNLLVCGFFILGFPDETPEDMNRTIQFALRSGIDRAYFGNYIPLPGTEDFQRLVQQGEISLSSIDWRTYTTYFGRIPYHPPAVSEAELMKTLRSATLRFYLRPIILFRFFKFCFRPRTFFQLLQRIYLMFLRPQEF